MTAIHAQFIERMKRIPEEFGNIRDWYLGEEATLFVVIFQDNPENWSVRLSIARALKYFKDIRLFFQVGTSIGIQLNNQNAMALIRAVPDENIREKAASYFLRKLIIHPAEYANIFYDREIQLFGVEDENLYENSLRFFKNQSKFLPLQIERARVITRNMLEKMENLHQTTCVLLCDGDLPDLVSEELEKRGLSYSVTRPKMTYPSDRERYEKLLFSRSEEELDKVLSYEDIINESDEMPPPPDENFPDKEMDDMKEKSRKKLIGLIESEELLPKHKDLLPPTSRKKVKKILSSKEEGPRTKAVRLKAVLLSLIIRLKEREKTQKIDVIFNFIIITGFIAAFARIIFEVGMQTWYLSFVTFLFGIACLGKTISKRFIGAFGCLLNILGFLVGYYFLGRWGMLLGIFIAVSIWIIVFYIQEVPLTKFRWGISKLL